MTSPPGMPKASASAGLHEDSSWPHSATLWPSDVVYTDSLTERKKGCLVKLEAHACVPLVALMPSRKSSVSSVWYEPW